WHQAKGGFLFEGPASTMRRSEVRGIPSPSLRWGAISCSKYRSRHFPWRLPTTLPPTPLPPPSTAPAPYSCTLRILSPHWNRQQFPPPLADMLVSPSSVECGSRCRNRDCRRNQRRGPIHRKCRV